jgi:16S rRNA (cytidine1402-2'-O)-methyltransferase
MKENNRSGELWLLPVPIHELHPYSVDPFVRKLASTCSVYITEKAKTARKWLREIDPDFSKRENHFLELNKHGKTTELKDYLLKVKAGNSALLISEAGCPGIADPGAEVVALAHKMSIPVRPLVGPSSIILALMASGFTGQRFYFQGYLPSKVPELKTALKKLEVQSFQEKCSMIFIETPYRNKQVLDAALESLQPGTLFSLALGLTGPDEWCKSYTIGEWKKIDIPELNKIPCVFIIQSAFYS